MHVCGKKKKNKQKKGYAQRTQLKNCCETAKIRKLSL